MTAGPGGRGPLAWSRRDRRIAGLLAVALLASLAFLVHPWFDAVGDGSIYVITARSLLAGDGYTYLEAPFRVRPPGFALLIAPVVALADTNFGALNLIVALFGAVGVWLLFALARPRIGAVLAALAALAVWLNPGYQKLSTQILSDVPGTTLLLGCLLLERRASRSPSTGRELALGAAIGLSAYVRSTFVLLPPAIVAARALQRIRWGAPAGESWPRFFLRRALPFAAVALAVVLPWSIRNARSAPETAVDQTLIYDYWTAQWHFDGRDPDSPLLSGEQLWRRSGARARQIVEALGSRLQPDRESHEGPPPGYDPAQLAVTLVLVAALVYGASKRSEPPELFAIGLLLLLLGYFGFDNRLLVPVFTLAIPNLAEGLRDGVARLAGPRAATWTAALALGALAVLDAAPRRDWDRIEREHRRFVANCEAARAWLPADARVASSFGWHYGLCLERPVFTLLPGVRRRGLRAVEEIIDRHRVDTIVLEYGNADDWRIASYLLDHYGEGQQVEGLYFWRVRPRP